MYYPSSSRLLQLYQKRMKFPDLRISQDLTLCRRPWLKELVLWIKELQLIFSYYYPPLICQYYHAGASISKGEYHLPSYLIEKTRKLIIFYPHTAACVRFCIRKSLVNRTYLNSILKPPHSRGSKASWSISPAESM